MRKTFQYLAIALMAMVLPVSVVSCSDDDDNNSILNDSAHDPEIVGTWEHVYEDEYDIETETYVFKKDGKYEFSETEYDKMDRTTEYYKEKGKWYTHGSRLYIEVTSSMEAENIGDQDDFSYFVDNKQLYLDGELFKKKK